MRASLLNHSASATHSPTHRRRSRKAQQQQHRSLVCRHSSSGDSTPTSHQPLPGLVKQWSDLYSQFSAADQLPASAIAEDALSKALEQLQQAAEVEDYETAATLRDCSLAWLGGWYRPAANPQARASNSSSSLLYVGHTEPNRWTGLLFTPADFMHYDLQGNCNISELQMADMLQQARYGTPLFEVFVLPQPQQQQQVDAPPATSSSTTSSSSSSSFVPVVVALQSVNRAFNELLGVQPSRRKGSAAVAGPDQPRLTNQRLLLLVQPRCITAAAVHAGNDSTLWTWHISTAPPADGTSSTAQSSQGACSGGPVVSGPLRPAGTSGGCRSGLTIDQYNIDHLRGPGSLARTGPDSFSFCRQPLPADVLSVLGSSGSSSGGSDGGWDGSSVQLFRVDLQYSLPPAEAADAAAAGAEPSAAAESAAGGVQQEAAASSDSSSSSSDKGWAQRVAAELCELLDTHQDSSSSSITGLQHSLAELLAAAADGTAPPGGAVSEAQQAASVVQVPLGGGSSDEGAATPPAVAFVRLVEPSATLSFGGWQVTASLT